MTHPELEKLLDELGIQSPVEADSQPKPAEDKPIPNLPLVLSVGGLSAFEEHLLSAMWRRFELSPVHVGKMSIFSQMNLITKQSKPGAPVVIIVGRQTILTKLFAMLVAAKYNGRRVHLCVVDCVACSLTGFQRTLFSRLASYADRTVCFSARESGRLQTEGVTADVLYPIVETTHPEQVSSGTPQPRLVSYLRASGSELSTLIKGYSLVKAKYPRAELTIFTDSCNVANDTVAGVSVQPLNGCMKEFESAHDIYVNVSSLSGGFLPFMVAQTAGLPCIVTDFGDVRELAVHGDNAVICRLNDPVSLADAIIALVEQDDLRHQITESAKLCCNDYSFDSLRDDWARFLGLSY